MASNNTIPVVANVARVVEAQRPARERVSAVLGPKERTRDALQSVGQRRTAALDATRAAFAPLADALAGVKPAAESFRTRIPEGLIRTARRWASLSPRQRGSAILAEVRRRARRVPAAFRAALSRALARTRAKLDALSAQVPPTHLHRVASPSHGPPLALVLLDSTRPVHGPPLAA